MTLEARVNGTNLSGWRTVILKEQLGNLVYSLYGGQNANRPGAHVAASTRSASATAP